MAGEHRDRPQPKTSMEHPAKRLCSMNSAKSEDALKKLLRLGDIGARMINGEIPVKVREAFEQLTHEDARSFFRRKSGIEFLERLVQLLRFRELQYLFEELNFGEAILYRNSRWLMSVAMEADMPCIDMIRYLVNRGCVMDINVCKKWVTKTCPVDHLRRLAETFFELAPDFMTKYGIFMVHDLYSSVEDRDERRSHMEALRGLIPLTARNASLICQTRTSPERGARIVQIVEENSWISEYDLIEIYELVELFHHLEADTPPVTLPFLKLSITLKNKLNGMPTPPYECQGRRMVDSLEEVDALENQMANGEFTATVWQLLLIAAKHGLVYNAIRWSYFKSLKNADELAATKEFVTSILGRGANHWFLPKIGLFYARLLSESEPPLIVLQKLYFFLESWFETKPEKRSHEERSLFVILVRTPIRALRSMSSIEEQLRQLRGRYNELLFMLAFALASDDVPEQILRVHPSYGASLRPMMMKLAWLLITKGASLSRLPHQAQSTLRTLMENCKGLPPMLRQALAARICCANALTWQDRNLYAKLADPKQPPRLHCMALAACKQLPRAYFKGKISRRGLDAVSRHRPLI